MSHFLDLNNYIKQYEIGHGTFGEVFKVTDKDTGNIFAAKISYTELDQNDSTFIMSLKREVNILSQLNHPSVLRFIGYSPFDFNQESYPVIITEYSPSGSLDDIIKLDRKHNAPQAWTDTKKLINIYGIASAMSYLHSHNIIHRDLKPANILENENLFPKIADFGLSKNHHQRIDSTTAKSAVTIKGTPIYIAPEIWINSKYTKAGDVYAFSIIVYEILTLDEPFKNYNFFTLCSKVAVDGDRPTFKYPLPDCYIDLIERCWSSNPSDRPSFQEIVEELRTNKEFIVGTIDEEEYFNYIDMIDNSEYLFDPNKKLKAIIPDEEQKEQIYPATEEKINESGRNEYITNIPTNMTVGMFNNLPLKTQQLTISNIIDNKGKLSVSNLLLNMNKLLLYFQQLKVQQEGKHFSITTKDEETQLEEIFEGIIKITLFHEIIEHLEEKTIMTSELNNYFNYFDTIYIEIKYPTTTFERNYIKVLNLKEKNEERIRINILISGIKKTDMAFQNNKNIDSVQIDTGVTEIDNKSFQNCLSLRKVTISSTVNFIGEYSLTGCTSLTQIMIPISIKSIENGLFYKCSSLTQISIPSSVISIGEYAFYECSSLAQISFPSSVASIGKHAFDKCTSLTQISIPSSVNLIEECVFNECSSLTKIIIPSSIKSIEYCAFKGCSLLRKISIPFSVTSICEKVFYGCSSLTQISISSSVTSIGKNAFYKCSSLTQISIPSSVTSIENGTFYECSSLTQISIPSSVTSIGEYAFYECSSLTQISIPSSVTSIKNDTFSGCSSLTQISIPSSVTSIENGTFSGCSSLTQISIPSSVTSIGEYAFYKCSSLTQISIPSSVTSIKNDTFSGCSSLTQISIPSSVTSIRNYAFSECSSLAQISIPSSVTSIGNRTFSGCSSLTQISIPSSVTSIGNFAFYKCSSLTQISISSSVTSIGEYAFSKCSSLTQISIPSSVTSIGNFAFYKCSSLTQISIPSSVTSIGEYSFSKCSSLTQITIPLSVKLIEQGTFSGCISLTEIQIPSSVTSIGSKAFFGCASLYQLTIPSSVVQISEQAFEGCPLLEQKTLESNSHLNDHQSLPIAKSNPSSTISNSQDQIIEELSSSKDAPKLIQYLHNSCENDTISMVYEKCHQESPDFYINLINEGILINDAVSHYKYATLCIIESFKQKESSDSSTKLNEAVNHLKMSAKNGYLYSYFLLSILYYNIHKKDVSAFNTAFEGAKHGEKHCKCLIGYFISHGIGTKKNFMKGISIILSNKVDDFYERFATDIGIYYTKLNEKIANKPSSKSSDDEDLNKKTAFGWFKLAFDINKTKATINNLGVCYLFGFGVDKDIKKAEEIFEIGLSHNSSNSMYHMGFIYEEKDPMKSLQLYKNAADQNNVHAQLQYAFNVNKTNKEESFKYYTLASNQGNSKSQVSLAKILQKTDNDESFSLYKKAAENGNIEAQEYLVKKFTQDNDPENSYKYCKMLIKNGNTRVPLEFAVNLYKSQKFEQAFYYFSLLSSVNHPIASYFLGIMNFYGQGCEKNKKNSYKILKELSNKGIEKASKFIEDHFDLK